MLENNQEKVSRKTIRIIKIAINKTSKTQHGCTESQ